MIGGIIWRVQGQCLSFAFCLLWMLVFLFFIYLFFCACEVQLSPHPDWNFRFFLTDFFVWFCFDVFRVFKPLFEVSEYSLVFFLRISIYKSPCFFMGLTMQAHGNCCKHSAPVMIIHFWRLDLDADSCFGSRQLFHHTTFLLRKRLYSYNLSWPSTVYQSTDIMHSRSQTEWRSGLKIGLTQGWSCARLQDSGWSPVSS